LNDIVIAGRPPGGTNSGGPFDDFGGTGRVTLAAGQLLTYKGSRTFTVSDPTGSWYTYTTYQTADGLWHDSTEDVPFTLLLDPPATPTNTTVPPTITLTNTPVPPSSTATNTRTNTPVPPTSTPTTTPATSTYTATNTPVPPTSTNTPLPPTSTRTNTPVPPTSTNTPTVTATPASGSYPRIANEVAFVPNGGQVTAMSRYNLIVSNNRVGTTGDLQSLKSASPGIKVIAYIDSSAIQFTGNYQLIHPADVYPGWYMMLPGTTLSAAVTTTSATSISVVDGTKFSAGQDVLVDGESMHVNSVSGNTLTVQRGYYSTAATHGNGARIAPHASNWSGVWMMNITPYCPTNGSGQTWETYLAAQATSLLASYPFDGVMFDNADYTKSYVEGGQLDANNDNVADGGNGPSGTGWKDGETNLFRDAGAQNPGKSIMGNMQMSPSQPFYSGATGESLEGFPGGDTWLQAWNQYMAVAAPGGSGQDSVISPKANNATSQNLQQMRFALAGALMGNGYLFYDDAAASGPTWWYDEYDNGAGSSLASSINGSQTNIPLVAGSGGKFHVGNVVQVPGDTNQNDEQMLVTSISGDTLNVQRGYNGTGGSTHSVPAKLFTAAQEAAGKGWLGQPLRPYTTVTTNVYRRDFTNGTVLLNASGSTQTVNVGVGYHRIAGTQDTTQNSGAAVTSVTIAANDGILLTKP
jgi:hypothetical protein